MYPQTIEQLIKNFSRLPGVGRRTAERFVFYLLKSGKKDVAELVLSLKEISNNIQSCSTCWSFSDTNPCKICGDSRRDRSVICVVAEQQHIENIERTKIFNGTYHILRGIINPDEEDTFKNLKIQELLIRIKNTKINEIILALNPDIHGETTMMFLEQQIKKIDPKTKISRLAKGLAMGSDLQYADEITLENSLKNRK